MKLWKQFVLAKEVFNAVQLNKSQFYNNVSVKHDHPERVTDLQFSESSRYMISIDVTVCKVWKVVHNLLGCIIKIPASLDAEHKEEKVAPLCAVDNEGTLAAIYRGKLRFILYDLDEHGDLQLYAEKDWINLRKELFGNKYKDFDYTPQRDKVRHIKFIIKNKDDGVVYEGAGRATHLRVYMVVNKRDCYADVFLEDYLATLTYYEKYSDVPIFNKIPNKKLTPQIQVRRENMKRMIAAQNASGNEILFPSEDTRLAAVFVKEDRADKHYKIFDNLRNQFIRRVAKKTMFDEATSINNLGTLLAFVEDGRISVRSIRMPNNATLVENLRPRIAMAELKLNPA